MRGCREITTAEQSIAAARCAHPLSLPMKRSQRSSTAHTSRRRAPLTMIGALSQQRRQVQAPRQALRLSRQSRAGFCGLANSVDCLGVALQRPPSSAASRRQYRWRSASLPPGTFARQLRRSSAVAIGDDEYPVCHRAIVAPRHPAIERLRRTSWRTGPGGRQMSIGGIESAIDPLLGWRSCCSYSQPGGSRWVSAQRNVARCSSTSQRGEMAKSKCLFRNGVQ